MAYFSMITEMRDFTEAETQQLGVYIDAQLAAGTTNDIVYRWVINKAPDREQNVRIWGTSESATGYQALLEGFSPPIPVLVY